MVISGSIVLLHMFCFREYKYRWLERSMQERAEQYRGKYAPKERPNIFPGFLRKDSASSSSSSSSSDDHVTS